jgi:hypothetical protein
MNKKMLFAMLLAVSCLSFDSFKAFTADSSQTDDHKEDITQAYIDQEKISVETAVKEALDALKTAQDKLASSTQENDKQAAQKDIDHWTAVQKASNDYQDAFNALSEAFTKDPTGQDLLKTLKITMEQKKKDWSDSKNLQETSDVSKNLSTTDTTNTNNPAIITPTDNPADGQEEDGKDETSCEYKTVCHISKTTDIPAPAKPTRRQKHNRRFMKRWRSSMKAWSAHPSNITTASEFANFNAPKHEGQCLTGESLLPYAQQACIPLGTLATPIAVNDIVLVKGNNDKTQSPTDDKDTLETDLAKKEQQKVDGYLEDGRKALEAATTEEEKTTLSEKVKEAEALKTSVDDYVTKAQKADASSLDLDSQDSAKKEQATKDQTDLESAKTIYTTLKNTFIEKYHIKDNDQEDDNQNDQENDQENDEKITDSVLDVAKKEQTRVAGYVSQAQTALAQPLTPEEKNKITQQLQEAEALKTSVDDYVTKAQKADASSLDLDSQDSAKKEQATKDQTDFESAKTIYTTLKETYVTKYHIQDDPDAQDDLEEGEVTSSSDGEKNTEKGEMIAPEDWLHKTKEDIDRQIEELKNDIAAHDKTDTLGLEKKNQQLKALEDIAKDLENKLTNLKTPTIPSSQS